MPLPFILTLFLACPCYPEIKKVIVKQGNTAMKAYLYNGETGLYEGETFEESAMLVYEDGITTVPPPDYVNGQVPVFNRGRQVWEVLPVAIVRQLLSCRPSRTKDNPNDHL